MLLWVLGLKKSDVDGRNEHPKYTKKKYLKYDGNELLYMSLVTATTDKNFM